ncbi:MAG: hypothetical protein ACR2MP_22625 [Streptosporangiaceae bacterium]
MSNTDRLAMRLTDADQRFMAILASHIQFTRKTPFVQPGDCVREALAIAAETLAKRNAPKAEGGSK